MRSYGIRFSASDISEAYAQETLNRVNSFNKGYRESSPDFVENFANMLNAYPTMDKEIAAIAALEGIKAEDQLGLDLANNYQQLMARKNTQDLVTDVGWGKRKFQQGMLWLDSMFQPVSRGFKSAVVAAQSTGQSVPATVGAATLGGLYSAFTPGTSTANFLDSMIGPGIGNAFETAKAKYGPTEFKLALEQTRKGKPLNLGSGFLPNSVDLKNTQIYLDEVRKGSDNRTAMRKAADVYGLPVTQLFDAREDQFKYTTKRGEKINISPGRIVAAQMLEPGTTGYSVVSGVVDGVFRLAADPMNLGLMYGAGVKNSMRTLVQANRKAMTATDKVTSFVKGFLPGKTGKYNRAAFYGRTVDDVRKTGWGQKFGEAIASLKGDEGRAFLADIPEFKNIPASVQEVLIQVDNADDVWNVLDVVAKGGDLTMKEFDNMFNLMSKALPNKKLKADLSRIRELSVQNTNFGLGAIPARPTVTGEFFNFVAKVLTGATTDVAPLRRFMGMFAGKNNPVKGLLGVGTQMKNSLPRHIQRAISLRPEATMLITNVDEAAKNADDMLKLSFAGAKTRGAYRKEILEATSQGQMDDLANRINLSITKNIQKQNPKLEIDLETIMKQQERFNSEIEEIRQFLSNSAGGSIAFNGSKINIKVTKYIKDLEKRFKKLGIEVPESELQRTVLEAVPTMHLLSQASDNFAAQLVNPQDVIRATKAHQTLIGPEDSLLRAWVNKPKDIMELHWAEAFKIPRKALKQNAKNNRLELKPKGPIDTFLDEFQNNVLKPAWMLRLALMLRIAPEEAVRAIFGGQINFISTPFQRAALTSNKEFGFVGKKVREDTVLQAYNNLGEIVMTSRMGPDDVEFLKNMMDVDDLKDFQAIDYRGVEKLVKTNLLEINSEGVISDYLINAAVKDYDLRDIRFAQHTEKVFKPTTKKINAKANGAIQGYDGKTYESMGEAIVLGGGFSTDLDVAKYIDLKTRKLSDADAFVSPYKEKEFSLGKIEDITAKAKELNITSAAYIDSQIDNVFMDDETIKLLSKDKHVLGSYVDDEGNFLLDVAIGLEGENAITNAVHMGANAFQESVYIANRALAEASGFGNLVNDDGLIYLYRAVEGRPASAINIDSVLNKRVLETMFKSNFDGLGLKVDDVKGAAQGMPGAGLFTTDESYRQGLGEAAVVQGLTDGRKDVAENAFIMVDKYLPGGAGIFKRGSEGVDPLINPRYWEGLWEELSLLAGDPNVVKLVNIGIEDMMVYLRNDVAGKRHLDELVRRSHNSEDKLYLTDDQALREYLESLQYRVGKAIGNPTAKILDPVTGKELSNEMTQRIKLKGGRRVHPKFQVDMNVGTNTKLFQFIKGGGVLRGRDWIRYNEHIYTFGMKERGKVGEKFFKEFIEMMEDEIVEAGLGPMRIPRKFDLKNRVSETGTVIAGQEIKAAGWAADMPGSDEWWKVGGSLLEKGYGLLITKPSNWLNRDPLFRYAFYDNAKEVIRYMDEPTKRQFIKESEVWIDGNPLWDDLKKIAKEPSLENTVTSMEQANKLLKTQALNEVLSLFYSTSQRHVASDLFSKYIPFPEIWAEVATTWGRLITENPQKFNRARIAIDNGTEAKPWDSENGFFSKDPNTGKMMFNYIDVFNVLTLGVVPLAGKLINQTELKDSLPDFITSPYQTAVFGQDLQEQGVRATMPGFAAGLNLVAQNGFAPGFGPTVTIPARVILNAIGTSRGVRRFFLGDFESSGQLSDQLPAWAKKFLTWEGTPDEDLQRTFASTQMDLYTAYVLAGLVDQEDAQSVQYWLEESQKQARHLFVFRGMAQFSLPTAIQPRIEIEDKDGTWWATQTLVNKYGELLIKNGYDHFQTQQDFIEKFGINPIPLKQPGQYSVGKQPIKENSFFFWSQPEYKKLLEALPNTAYYINPDKIEDELYFPAYYETVSVGLTPAQQSNFMRHSQAIFEYEKGKADIRSDESIHPNEKDRRMSELKMEIEDEYGGIDMFNFQGKPQSVSIKSTMNELRSWEQYPEMVASKEYQYVQKYLDYRDEILDVLTKGGSFEYGEKQLIVGRPKYKSRLLTGTSQQKIDAREIMIQIWNDIINEGEGTNFPQLANEVLFYELSPNNSQNSKD